MARVLVTGATGYIASFCLAQLIRDGHEVRGTARSVTRAAPLSELLSGYLEQSVSVPIMPADLTRDEGWAEACEGMDYVLHVASPFPAQVPKDPNEVIAPARDGTIRVLKAATAAGVKRVVMTSSVAAVTYGWNDEDQPDVFTEDHWSNPDNLKRNTPYTRSKAIAERAAWDYIDGGGEGLELSVINPAAVLGPTMSPGTSASLELVTQLLQGKVPAMPRIGFQIVDVRDVADAHVRAMTHPGAAGQRYIVSDDFYWWADLAALIRAEYPEHARKVPTSELPNWLVRGMTLVNPLLKQVVPELGQKRIASSDKAKRELGWSPRSAAEAIRASVESLIAST